MRSVKYEKYGDPEVLEFQEFKKPFPKDNEVLIKVYSTSVTNADCLMRKADSFVSKIFLGFRKPRKKILGSELSGKIEAIGKDVKRFKVGESVYGFTGFGLGAYSEYKCMPENGSLVSKPQNINYTESVVLVDGASTALFFLRDKGKIKQGDNVLIIGASGSIGSYAVQIAKYFEATVTGVCSTHNIEFVKSIGADTIIDYKQEDFTKGEKTYDIIFDTAAKSSFSKCKRLLNPKGKYLVTMIKLKPLFQTLWTKLFSSKKVIFAMSINKTHSLEFIKELVEKERLKPIIDKIFPFDKMIDAHKYAENKHNAGNVAVSLVN